MKRTVFVLINILIAGFVSLQSQQLTPSASFEKEVHDFGTIQETGGLAKYDFKFVNLGGAPLILKNVHASCGCTTPQWPREPIMPGEDGFITVSYNPSGRPGSFVKQITVTTNGNPETIMLQIKGNVNAKPPSIEDRLHQSIDGLRMESQTIKLGPVTPDQKTSKIFDVFNSTDTTMEITFSNVPKHIKVIAKDKIIKPKQASIIEITFDAAVAKEWGDVSSRFNLSVNGKKSPGNVITAIAIVQEDFSKLTEEQRKNAPALEFQNTRFNFDTITSGKTVDVKYKFKNSGKSELIIRKVSASCGCIVSKLKSTTIKPGEESEIAITFDSSNKRNKQLNTINVYSNDPSKPRIDLRIEGFIK